MDFLSVNIEVAIDKLEEKEVEKEIIQEEPELEEVRKTPTDIIAEEMSEEEKQEAINAIYEETRDVEDRKEESVSERDMAEPIDIKETTTPVKVEVETETKEVSEYTTYRVYILREDDHLETVIQKYGVTREQLEEYNQLGDLKIGDKLIIPDESIH